MNDEDDGTRFIYECNLKGNAQNPFSTNLNDKLSKKCERGKYLEVSSLEGNSQDETQRDEASWKSILFKKMCITSFL